MFDTIQIILWSVTYLLIIVDSLIDHKSPGIPAIAVILNFSWEIVAVMLQFLNHGTALWGNVLWLGLDTVIFSLFIAHSSKQWKLLIVSVLGGIFLLVPLFWVDGGQLLTSYICDVVMATAFLYDIYQDRIRRSRLSFFIAITKCIGDFFAWQFYKNHMLIVNVLGAVVFLLNLLYIAFFLAKDKTR